MTVQLPIYEIISKLKTILNENNNLVLQAPPGAGKTTIVPIQLLEEKWLAGKKIILLEPRRLAARAAARRMALTIGEVVGETIGYRVRMDQKIGKNTRIEVVTEGVLIRKLQSDPELSDVGLLIFDEFHERSIEADLGLALSLDVQGGLRADLKIIVMSATLDGKKVADLMGGAPILSSEGRAYDVEHKYLSGPSKEKIEYIAAAQIERALQDEKGSILVFLPGAGEIERTKKILEGRGLKPNVTISPLYGMMNFKDQDLAINPAPEGFRKIVLATAIAESSLTIEGIRVVVDSGLQRSTIYDAGSGMTKLQTSTLSRASADQRAGRAGRTEEGVCYRLWTEASNRALRPYSEPEIKRTDLVPLALDLALWGVKEASTLAWLDPPEQASLLQANELLMSLGGLDGEGKITTHGKMMARFPMHPRFAHMILSAEKIGLGKLALSIAALMEERDILRLKAEYKTVDLRLRLEALQHMAKSDTKNLKRLGCDIGAARNVNKQVNNWLAKHCVRPGVFNIQKAGICLAYAFPDRIGSLRSNQTGTYILSGGRGARLMQEDPLALESFLAVGHLDKGDKNARVYMASPISKIEIEEGFGELISEEELIYWDDRTQSVKAESQRRLGKMFLANFILEKPDKEIIKSELLKGIRKLGIDVLPWDSNSIRLRRRVDLARKNTTQIMVDFSDKGLLNSMEDWLLPYLDKVSSIKTLQRLDIHDILKNILSWEESQQLDVLVPTHIKVPSGSNIAIDYSVEPPILSVKLQEMFGATDTPRILNGTVDLSIHLLSPARRPLQITSDLKGFWSNSYPEIKKEMKGRYPKHPWPDNPHQSYPTKKLEPKK